MRSLSIVFVFVLLGMASCNSSKKLMEDGAYDQVIYKYIDKLKKTSDNNPKYVTLIEEAYQKALLFDNKQIIKLQKSQEFHKYQKLFDIAARKKRRKDLIDPYIPLVAKNGYKASFDTRNIDEQYYDLRNRAAAEVYRIATETYDRAKKQQDKRMFQQAYREFEQLNTYNPNYKNARELQQKALEAGSYVIGLQIINRTERTFVGDVKYHLIQTFKRDRVDEFIFIDDMTSLGNSYDYKCELIFDYFDLSPEQVQERIFPESKEIEVGEQEVRDGNGKVVRDSTGKAEKEKVFEWAHAEVTEVRQYKDSYLKGRLNFFDNYGKRVNTVPIDLTNTFENFAARFDGDRRALSTQTKRRLGGGPVNFPTDKDMFGLFFPEIENMVASSTQSVVY